MKDMDNRVARMKTNPGGVKLRELVKKRRGAVSIKPTG
ncbi:Uncharacterised protein [Yersinia frederiksenii]|nr:Uncharacterised protein [Yersinia frederiksenii]CNL33720.1 Uncharacterised protein [Yersinia frederiksenii]